MTTSDSTVHYGCDDVCGETSRKGFQHIQTSDSSVAVIRYCTDCQEAD